MSDALFRIPSRLWRPCPFLYAQCDRCDFSALLLPFHHSFSFFAWHGSPVTNESSRLSTREASTFDGVAYAAYLNDETWCPSCSFAKSFRYPMVLIGVRLSTPQTSRLDQGSPGMAYAAYPNDVTWCPLFRSRP